MLRDALRRPGPAHYECKTFAPSRDTCAPSRHHHRENLLLVPDHKSNLTLNPNPNTNSVLNNPTVTPNPNRGRMYGGQMSGNGALLRTQPLIDADVSPARADLRRTSVRLMSHYINFVHYADVSLVNYCLHLDQFCFSLIIFPFTHVHVFGPSLFCG